MIPNRFYVYIFSFFMCLFMSGVMSLAMLSMGATSISEMFLSWPRAWAVAMLVAFPTNLLVVPLTHRLIAKIVAAN